MRYLSVVAALVVSQLSLAEARAQWADDIFVEQSLMACFEEADGYVENNCYGYTAGVSVVGSFMAPSDRFTFNMYFEGGRDLMIISAGDQDAIDVDLRVRDFKGGLLDEDTSHDAHALVEFSTVRAATYSVEVELYSADADAFVSFVVLEAGGGYVPFSDLELAMHNMLDMWRGGVDLAVEEGIVMNFNRRANQPCLFGALLQGDQQVSLTNLSFDNGDMLAFATGDSDVQDLDLVVYDDRHFELQADRSVSAVPVVSCRTSDRRWYEVELINAARAGTIPTFCLVSLVELN